ncbi:MAG: hypothetical protein LC720_07825 [Actinobacteria bacterium]|nr:hypothetical protein [Actinomycetota bacterium]
MGQPASDQPRVARRSLELERDLGRDPALAGRCSRASLPAEQQGDADGQRREQDEQEQDARAQRA